MYTVPLKIFPYLHTSIYDIIKGNELDVAD